MLVVCDVVLVEDEVIGESQGSSKGAWGNPMGDSIAVEPLSKAWWLIVKVVAILGAQALKLVAYVPVCAITHEGVVVVLIDESVSVDWVLEEYSTLLNCGRTREGKCECGVAKWSGGRRCDADVGAHEDEANALPCLGEVDSSVLLV